MNLVDTSGWIEFFFGGENASEFVDPIEDLPQLIVPVVCLYEVFKKIYNVGDEAKALQAVAQMKQGRVVELNEDIALRAALISLRHKLPMADSFIYATGQLNEALVWTQDADFEGLPGVRYVEARDSRFS
jgi:predicted nucleic acid-binding protein